MAISNRPKWRVPVFVFVISLSFYGISAGTKINEKTKTPQYVYLAYSFLHGKADLIQAPRSKFDLISFQDRWYVPGGMGPALLLMPVVAVFGLDTSDVFFGVVIGALNVAFMFSLLDKINHDRSTVRNSLTVLFAAGTVHWWVSSVGSVWFNAQLAAVLFMILFAGEALGRNRPWLAGAWLGLTALSRPTTLFSFPFYLTYVFSEGFSWKIVYRKILPFGITLIGFVVLVLSYNFVRFGHPLEFGYLYFQGTDVLTNPFARSGGFSSRYIPCNAYVSILGLPNLPSSPIPRVNDMCSHLGLSQSDFGPASSFFNP